MARNGVTYADVARAARTLCGEGHEPTVERVRQWLGSGSNSTIAPLLKRWRTQKDEITSAELPEDLLEAVKALQERLQLTAKSHIEIVEAELEAQLDDLRRQWDQSQQSASRLTDEKATLQAHLEAAQAENQRLGQLLEEVRVAAARTESQRDEISSQLAALKTLNAEEKKRNDLLQERFEHYQQRSAEERQQEKEAHRLAAQHYQQQIHQMADQQNKAESRFEQLQVRYNQQQDASNQQRDELVSVQDRHTRLKADMEALMLRLREMITARDALQKSNEQLHDRAAELTGELAAARSKAESLAEQLNDSRATCATAMRQIATLQEHNSQVAHEKSLIQGQLKELQSQNQRRGKERAPK